mmetsp:Transcript_4926/g.11545  ORF Transcript_4926/g.11545 Transcript_4926/m.11545 type:complete len:235 (+) Transcript_4926:360-1064(+)
MKPHRRHHLLCLEVVGCGEEEAVGDEHAAEVVNRRVHPELLQQRRRQLPHHLALALPLQPQQPRRHAQRHRLPGVEVLSGRHGVQGLDSVGEHHLLAPPLQQLHHSARPSRSRRQPRVRGMLQRQRRQRRQRLAVHLSREALTHRHHLGHHPAGAHLVLQRHEARGSLLEDGARGVDGAVRAGVRHGGQSVAHHGRRGRLGREQDRKDRRGGAEEQLLLARRLVGELVQRAGCF